MKIETYILGFLSLFSIIVSVILGVKNIRLSREHLKLQKAVKEEASSSDRTKYLMDCMDKIASERTEFIDAVNLLCTSAEENNSGDKTRLLDSVKSTQVKLFNSLERLAYRLNNGFFDEKLIKSQVLPTLPTYIEQFIQFEVVVKKLSHKPLLGRTPKSGDELKIFTAKYLPERKLDELTKKAEEEGLYHWNLDYYKRMHRK
jgi:hypothetical protein